MPGLLGFICAVLRKSHKWVHMFNVDEEGQSKGVYQCENCKEISHGVNR